MTRISRRSLTGGLIAMPFAIGGARLIGAQSADSTPAATSDNSVVDVDMLDTFKFEPSEFEISKGGTIRLHNKGFLEHDFEVDAWEGKEMEQYAKAGETVEVIVPDDAEVGTTYDFWCTVAGHKEGGMVGKLTVVEGTATASPEASPAASPSASPAAGGGASVDVDMLDTFKFEPNEFEIAKGGTIRLHNKGFLEHDFEVDAWEGKEMEQYAKAGETVEVIVPDDAEVGTTYDFWCTVAGHKEGGMVGKLTVTEG